MSKSKKSMDKDLDKQREILAYQLDILNTEIQNIDNIISHVDNTSQSIKNWTIVTWAGSIGLALSQKHLSNFVLLTGILPLIFWFIDARWKRNSRRAIFRSEKIQEFLNDGGLARSIEKGKLINFSVYDPVGKRYSKKKNDPHKTEVYKKYYHKSSYRSAFFSKDIWVFYLALIVISISVGTLLRIFPIP